MQNRERNILFLPRKLNMFSWGEIGNKHSPLLLPDAVIYSEANNFNGILVLSKPHNDGRKYSPESQDYSYSIKDFN